MGLPGLTRIRAGAAALLVLACLAAVSGRAAPSAAQCLVQERHRRAARAALRAGLDRRQGAAALGAVRRVPEQPDARRDEESGLQAFDTQLDAAEATTQALKLEANNRVLAVAGPAVSDEVTRRRRDLRPEPARVHLRLGDATALTVGADKVPTFFRTVGTDYAQSTTDADFIHKGLIAKSVWIVDDGTRLQPPLADRVERLLRRTASP